MLGAWVTPAVTRWGRRTEVPLSHRNVVYAWGYGRDWPNLSFLVITHVLGLAGLLHAAFGRLSLPTLAVAAAWYFLSFLAIAAGYHRFYAHRSHGASTVLEAFYVLFGAAAFQARAIDWASYHLDHHAYTDSDGDPHDIRKGFFWAHLGWLINRRPPADHGNVAHLAARPWVAWQARIYFPLALATGLALPAAICSLWGDALGGLLIAGFLRLALQYQMTFCVNSFAHTFGEHPAPGETARNSHGVLSWLLSFMTFGEVGKHGDHHTDSSRYRLARHWWEPDFAGTCIWLFLKLRLATPR